MTTNQKIFLRPKPRSWGISLPGHDDPSGMTAIVQAPPPARVVISLHQNLGSPSTPVVEVGEKVLTGQPISSVQPGLLSAPVHASISGTVAEITASSAASASGGESLISVTLDSDGADQRYTGYGEYRKHEQLSPAEIRRGVLEAGIVGLGGALFPSERKLNPGAEIGVLILNGAECEPYIGCDNILLKERAQNVLLGAEIILHTIESDRCIIAMKAEMTEARSAVSAAIEELGDDRIGIAMVPNRYPAGGERQLIEYLLNEEVPSGGLPWDVGVACQNVATAAAVANFFERGEPLISRIVTVTGSGVRRPVNIEARIGTPISELIGLAGGYSGEKHALLMGGPMMGVRLPADDLPVTKATNCIVVTEPEELQPQLVERPCIRCGECARVCPAYLLPQQLLELTKAADTASMESQGIQDCIQCGACDYVCPSHIPITRRLIDGKAVVWQAHLRDRRVLHVRQRHEAHERRKQRESAEKSKRLAEQVDALGDDAAVSKEAIDAVVRRATKKSSSPTSDKG